MDQRDHHRSGAPGQSRSPPRRSTNPVLALQRLIGNRGTTRVLARDKKGSKQRTFENSVRIGKLGPIEITGGNLAEWVAKKVPDDLSVTSTKGKHSEELKRLADSKTRFDKINVQAITGQNSWMVVTFKNARITSYTADDGTESWKLVDFDGVHRESTSIGVPRP